MAILYNRMASYGQLIVLEQKSGSMTLSWSTPEGQAAFTTQTLLVDSDSTGLQTLILDGSARQVTLSSDNVTVQYGTDVNYSFRLVGTLSGTGAKIKSNNLQEQHFYQLQAPQVTMVGVPDGIKLTFQDNLFGLDNYGATQVKEGNSVTNVEVSLSYVDPELGPDLDAYIASAAQVTGGTDGVGKVLFVGDPNTGGANTVGEAGTGLVNGRPYEVSVRYITSDLGFTPATLDQTVIPSDGFSAPQNVAVSRPSGDDAENNSIAVSFNGPSNDVNPDGTDNTFVGHYELWYKESSSVPADVNGDLDDDNNPNGWTNVSDKNLTPEADDEAALGTAFTIIQDGLDSGKLYWFAVRAVRSAVGGEANGQIKGVFSSPESGLVFNYVDVAAPTIVGNTTQGSTDVTVKCTYPAAGGSLVAATTFAEADVGDDLSVLGYESKFVVSYANATDGTGNTQTEFAANALNDADISGTIDFGALSVRKFIISATYLQTYKGVTINAATITTNSDTEFTSEDANAAAMERIFGSTSQRLTTFSAPAATSITASLTYNDSYEPLSTGKDDEQGELKVTWDALAQASAFVDGAGTTANEHFFGSIEYRVLVTGAGADNVSGNEGLIGTTAYLSGLNIGVNYSLTVQAYFVNPENAILDGGSEASTDQEVAGAESDAETNGTTPFYYPDPVVSSSDADGPSLYGDNLDKLRVAWDEPASLNGVGSAGSLVTLRYRYVLTTNGTAAAGEWVTDGQAEVTDSFAAGNGYQTQVWSGYQVTDGAHDAYNAGSTPFNIYYAKVKPLAVSLSTSSNTDPAAGVITATYTDGGNDSILVFDRVNSSISPNNGSAGTISATTPPTQEFSGLTNGTQYVVSATATHTFGGQEWTSLPADSGADNLDGIPFGKPIITTSSASLTGQVVSVTVNPNGRFIRESLFVGVPSTASTDDIGVQQTNGNTARYGSANDATPVTVSSTNFGYALAEGLIVVENAAGSDVFLKQ